MLETIRKGYWQPAEEVKQTLATEYIKSVTEYGTACSELICNNPVLEKYAMNVATYAGLLSKETLSSYTETIRAATGKALNERKEEVNKLIKTQAVKLEQIPGQMKQGVKPEEKHEETTEQKAENEGSGKTEAIEGYEMEEEKQEMEKGIRTSNISWITIAVISICIGLFYYGWRKGRKQC